MHGLEYKLWEAVIGKRIDVCSLEEIEQFKYLSENALDGSCGMNRRK
jgi:hypothetical protein